MSCYSHYPQPAEVYEHWVKTIMDEASEKLSEWETDFIASISNRCGNLSEKQARCLERIYTEKTA